MKVPIPSILLGMLSLSTYASAYLDHNELDARDSTNSLLVERNTVDVPFEPSLRSFLEGAAHAYQRALDDHDDLLEARNEKVKIRLLAMLDDVSLHPSGNGVEMEVYKTSNSLVMQKLVSLNYPQYGLYSAISCGLFDFTGRTLDSLADVPPGSTIVLDCTSIKAKAPTKLHNTPHKR
ncbi:hypothetical protein DFP72DRAFT_896071 [Ephemerocybe angulata]|uniref:Uncharacterized protein n=1 Tax=Ephemerocybe angulata TaxID=980116 RepID=A0A8H6HZ27_9AGAR|nr:hypothetical protein DFP72DRAFT_896071 [Tulosesus angulatus]